MNLIEREAELAALHELLHAARDGVGRFVMVEAPAGQGKTALLRRVRDDARAAGMRVLTATGASLERDFPFGVTHQLFEAELRGADEARRERLLSGSAGRAAGVFDAASDAAGAVDPSPARLNGLFWLTVNLSEEGPLALVVDDAHWADAPSLRFVDVLARRLEDLPVVLVLALRPGVAEAPQDLLDALALWTQTVTLTPAALSIDAVTALLEESLAAPSTAGSRTPVRI